MKVQINAKPFGLEGRQFLQIKSPVSVIHPIGSGQINIMQTEALWDTGATNTCIPMKKAIELGIPLGEEVPVLKRRTTEPSRYCQFYLQLPTGDVIFVPEALAMPKMQARFIIGMDVISKGRMTIEPDGSGGVRFTFSV